MLSNVFTVMGLATVASAHMIMTNPVPYGSPNNSPLDATGSDFPCKGISNPGGNDNTYKAGSTQQLSFIGTSVHGGGSCQVAVTTDLNPTTDSTWKVIKSIEGGCPARDTAGNLPGANAAAEDPYTYQFKIPDEMPSGEYVLAWTWFNKIGNREMYMNCASVEIEGGTDDDAFLDTLPDMFVANIKNGCTTADSADVEFPDPGQYLEQLNGATKAFAQPSGNCGASGAAPSSIETSEPTTTAATQPSTTAAVSVSVSITGGIFLASSSATATSAVVTEPAITATSAVVTEPAATATSAVAIEPATSATAVPTSGSGSGSSHTAGSACSSEGTWDCIGGSSYQRCASGVWSEVMEMAGGTTCAAGESSELSVAAAVRRRAVPFRV